MTIEEENVWLHKVAAKNGDLGADEKEIIICPPYTLLQTFHYKISTFNSFIKVGAQDVSPFDEGAYTGEIAASMLSEFCTYVIVGHSERREHFGEEDAMLEKKVRQALANNLTPIYCMQDEETKIPTGVTVAAYEPVFAIGTGKPDTPENAQNVIAKIKDNNPELEAVLYGGSITPENVRPFTDKDAIDGVLVGTASLDADAFTRIVHNA